MDERFIQQEIWNNCKKFDRYANGRVGIKRSMWFVNQIEELNVSSIFEVGCFVGRNLKYINQAYPEIKLGGLDINAESLEYARKEVPNAKLQHMSVYDMDDECWDLVFTMGVLIHIPPDGIEDVIKKCIKKANKYIIHIDRQGSGDILMGREEFNPKKTHDKFHWAPDIKGIYKKFGYDATVKCVPEELNRGGATHIVIVKKDK
jgi:SAM-dependent methyltransferase